MKRIKTLTTRDLKESMKKGGAASADILSVSLQNKLYRRKPELRACKIISEKRSEGAVFINK